MTEKSKVFISMGRHVGISEPRRSHRGIIAKRFLPRIQKYELAEFANSLKKISFRKIPIKSGGEVISYATI